MEQNPNKHTHERKKKGKIHQNYIPYLNFRKRFKVYSENIAIQETQKKKKKSAHIRNDKSIQVHETLSRENAEKTEGTQKGQRWKSIEG